MASDHKGKLPIAGKGRAQGKEMKELTPKMKETLRDVRYGVRLYRDGYFCTDEPEKRIDGRSLQALYSRGLIVWSGSGGSTYIINIYLTELGKEALEATIKVL